MDSEPVDQDPARELPVGGSRRSFIKRMVGGLAIAVPAFRVLLSPSPASADTPRSQPADVPETCSGGCSICSKVYVKYNGHKCQPYGIRTCPPPPGGGTCIGYYTIYSAIVTGFVCGSFEDNEGPCRG
jgi:hypothetical protein